MRLDLELAPVGLDVEHGVQHGDCDTAHVSAQAVRLVLHDLVTFEQLGCFLRQPMVGLGA